MLIAAVQAVNDHGKATTSVLQKAFEDFLKQVLNISTLPFDSYSRLRKRTKNQRWSPRGHNLKSLASKSASLRLEDGTIF